MDNKETNKGRHCIKYITDGPLKPPNWEYVPTKEITAQQQHRLKLFKGILVRRRKSESTREFFAKSTEIKDPFKSNDDAET